MRQKLQAKRRAPARLSPRERILWGHLNPWLADLKQRGWNIRTVGDAVIDHYERTRQEIRTEKLAKLLSPPTEIVINYRKRRGLPNHQSAAQQMVLKRLVPDARDRQKAVEILSKVYVVDMLGALDFKEAVEEIRSHKFVAPQARPCASGEGRQGRRLVWPEG
jgi:hypothetical protein